MEKLVIVNYYKMLDHIVYNAKTGVVIILCIIYDL